MLDSLNVTNIAQLPEFTHDEITRDYENSVLGRMPNAAGVTAPGGGTDYYASHHFDDSRFYGSRTAADGTVDQNTNRSAIARAGSNQISADRARDARNSKDNEVHIPVVGDNGGDRNRNSTEDMRAH